MLGIPFFSAWILEVILFVVAIGIGLWTFDSDLPWWAVLGLMGAVILLVLLSWGIRKVKQDSEPEA